MRNKMKSTVKSTERNNNFENNSSDCISYVIEARSFKCDIRNKVWFEAFSFWLMQHVVFDTHFS